MNSTAHLIIPPPRHAGSVRPTIALTPSRTVVPPCVLVPPIDPGIASVPAPTEWTEAQYDALMATIREVLDACADANTNERLIVVITVCIGEGVNTIGRIIGVAKDFGFERKHVGSLLTYSELGKARSPLWQRHKDGHYSLLD